MTPSLYSFLTNSPPEFRICEFNPLSANLKPTFDSLEKLSFSLYNILNSPLYIQNSLDTHFIISLLNQTNQLVVSSQNNYTQYLSSKDHSNPFIEVEGSSEIGYLEDEEFKFEALRKDIQDQVKAFNSKLEEWMRKKENIQVLNL